TAAAAGRARLAPPGDEPPAARGRSLVVPAFSPGAPFRHRWVVRQVRHSTWWGLPFFIDTMRWLSKSRQRVHHPSTSPATRRGLGIGTWRSLSSWGPGGVTRDRADAGGALARRRASPGPRT